MKRSLLLVLAGHMSGENAMASSGQRVTALERALTATVLALQSSEAEHEKSRKIIEDLRRQLRYFQTTFTPINIDENDASTRICQDGEYPLMWYSLRFNPRDVRYHENSNISGFFSAVYYGGDPPEWW